MKFKSIADRVAFGFLCVLALVHLGFILYFSVDIPFWDDWEMYSSNGLSQIGNWRWYFSFHNEHRIFLTRVLSAISHLINGRWIVTDLFINYLCFAAFGIVLLVTAIRQSILPVWMIALSVAFWFSPLTFNNQISLFLSQWHLSFLFPALSCYFFFVRSHLFFGALSTLLAIAAMTGSALSAIVIVALKTVRVFQFESLDARKKWIAYLGIFVPCAMAYLMTIPPGQLEHVYPWQGAFWSFWINLVSVGFGIEEVSTALSIICALFVLIPYIQTAWFERERFIAKPSALQRMTQWLTGPMAFWLVLSLSLIAHQMAVDYARGIMGPEAAKTYRFMELGLALVPVSLLAVLTAMTIQMRDKTYSIWLRFAPLIFVGVLSANQWDFFVYQMRHRTFTEGVECLKYGLQKSEGEIICPQVLPRDLRPYWESAKELGASFTRQK